MRAGREHSCTLVVVACALLACGKVQDATDSARSSPGGTSGGGQGSGEGASGGSRTGEGASGGSGIGEGASGGSGTAGTGSEPRDPEVPADVFERPTVWIGEVESPVTYPTTLGDDPSPERVILILDAIRSSVTGTITFGEGPLPAPDPHDVYPTWTSVDGTWPTLSENWDYSPFPGFPYSIVSSDLWDNRLSINFATPEIWADLCSQSGGGRCTCSDGVCESASEPVRRLELVVTGDSMAGQMSRPSGNWLGGVPAIRLQRVQ
jgi:hypothetical protein